MAEILGQYHHQMVPIPKVITFLSSRLERVSRSNDDENVERRLKTVAKTSAFHGSTKPNVSIRSYLERIFKYGNCSPSCFVVAYVYLDRFVQCQPINLPIDSFNVHRLLITSVLVSAKFLDDL